MMGTSFVKMRRRSGYGLTRASGSCSALTLLLTTLGHDSGSASDSVPRRWHGGYFWASAWFDSGYMVYVSPWVLLNRLPCSPCTWQLDAPMSPLYLALPVRCWCWRNAWFDCGYMFSSRVAFGSISTNFPRDWVDSAPEVILVVHCIWPMRKWPCSSSLTQWLAFPGFACDAPRAVSRRLPAGPFSSDVELHLEICTLFLRHLCIFSIFLQS